jgi:hypothetical protein
MVKGASIGTVTDVNGTIDQVGQTLLTEDTRLSMGQRSGDYRGFIQTIILCYYASQNLRCSNRWRASSRDCSRLVQPHRTLLLYSVVLGLPVTTWLTALYAARPALGRDVRIQMTAEMRWYLRLTVLNLRRVP